MSSSSYTELKETDFFDVSPDSIHFCEEVLLRETLVSFTVDM